MLSFMIILGNFAVLTLIIYFPVICAYIAVKRSEKKFLQLLPGLDELFAECLIVETKPLGLGPVDETCIPFSEAHKNQTFAINSIMHLLENYK